MLGIHFALFLAIVLVGFMAAWRFMPTGWLTASTGTLGAMAIALHEAISGAMPELKALLPEEHRPWLVILFLLLTVAARFRNRAATQ